MPDEEAADPAKDAAQIRVKKEKVDHPKATAEYCQTKRAETKQQFLEQLPEDLRSELSSVKGVGRNSDDDGWDIGMPAGQKLTVFDKDLLTGGGWGWMVAGFRAVPSQQ